MKQHHNVSPCSHISSLVAAASELLLHISDLPLQQQGQIQEIARYYHVQRQYTDFNQKEIMTNNDILRRVRYVFDYGDLEMISIFEFGGHQVTRAQISDWLKKEDDPSFKECSDTQLTVFLNGLIIEKRGKKDGPQPKPELNLNNNIIFRKLKIALNLKADDVLAIIALGDLRISKHELSAFFRKHDHKHYRECKDQILRKFLFGLQVKDREEPEK